MYQQQPESTPKTYPRDVAPRYPQDEFSQITRFLNCGLFEDKEALAAFQLKDRLGAVIYKYLSNLVRTNNADGLREACTALLDSKGKIPTEIVDQLERVDRMESRDSGRARPLLLELLLRQLPLAPFADLIKAGFARTRSFTVRGFAPEQTADGRLVTIELLHAAAIFGHPPDVDIVCSAGAHCEATMHSEAFPALTPLQYLGKELLNKTVPPSPVQGTNSTPTITLQNRELRILGCAGRLLRAGAEPTTAPMGHGSFLRNYLIWRTHSQNCVIDDTIRDALRTFVKSAPTSRRARYTEFLEVYSECLETINLTGRDARLCDLLSLSKMTIRSALNLRRTFDYVALVGSHERLAHEKTSEIARSIGEFIDPAHQLYSMELVNHMDAQLYDKRTNPWESELLALLTVNSYLKDEHQLNQITKALTAPFNFVGKKIRNLARPKYLLLRDLGVLTYSSRLFKSDSSSYYDTDGRKTTLFEEGGFRRLKDSSFGSCFVLEPRRGALLELDRGCIIGALKGVGTAVIRNSSPVFGRDLLEHSAYFSAHDPLGIFPRRSFFGGAPAGPVNSFAARVPDRLDHFMHCLDIELYRDDDALRAFREVVDFIFSTLHVYARWKLNLNRAEICSVGRDGRERLRAAAPFCYSPGFPHILQRVEDYNNRRQALSPYQSFVWVPTFFGALEKSNDGNIMARRTPYEHFSYARAGTPPRTELVLDPPTVHTIRRFSENRALASDPNLAEIKDFFQFGVNQSERRVQLMIEDKRRRKT